MEISDDLLQHIVYADEVKKAYQQALYFLAHRMRSEHEVAAHLRKNGAPDSVIDEVLKKLRAERYVDDEAFAAAYVRTQKNDGGERAASHPRRTGTARCFGLLDRAEFGGVYVG